MKIIIVIGILLFGVCIGFFTANKHVSSTVTGATNLPISSVVTPKHSGRRDDANQQGLGSASREAIVVTATEGRGLSDENIKNANEAYAREGLRGLSLIVAQLIDPVDFKKQNTSGDSSRLNALLNSDLHADVKNKFFQTYVCSIALDRSRLNAIVTEFASSPNLPPKTLSSTLAIAAFDKPSDIFTIFKRLPWHSDYSEDVGRVFVDWTADAPEEASKAALTLKNNSPMYEWAVAGVVQAIRLSDPAGAEIWSKELSGKALDFASSVTLIRREVN
jgi:hypothetical protein